jgi:hypothetical protein
MQSPAKAICAVRWVPRRQNYSLRKKKKTPFSKMGQPVLLGQYFQEALLEPDKQQQHVYSAGRGTNCLFQVTNELRTLRGWLSDWLSANGNLGGYT